jgi:hypothetical protein
VRLDRDGAVTRGAELGSDAAGNLAREGAMADAETRRAGARLIWLVVAFIVLGAIVALIVGRNAVSDEKSLAGRWTAKLTGYNTSVGAVTAYEQTVILAEGGTVTVQFDLGGMEPVRGTWELTRGTDEGKVIRISWSGDPTKVNEFKYQLKGNQLYLSRVQGGMPKPENLNVTEQDPVVYERGPDSQ